MSSRIVFAAAILLSLTIGPLVPSAQAQDDKVYPINELSNPPRLSSEQTAAKMILESYPEDLRRRHVGGVVEVQFIVDAQGKVQASSVEIVEATQTALGEAAKKVVKNLTFAPGTLNGTRVKSLVILPIVYKAGS